MKFPLIGKSTLAALFCSALLGVNNTQAQTLTNNATGTHNGFYYTFWKDSGDASMGLQAGGRYTSQWSNGTNNWVGGKGWNPGGPKVVNYSGSYNVDNSQNSYLALYGWTRSPLIEYYVIESYGSYNPASCSGGTDYGSFQSDGATYNVRRCQRVQQPSIDGTQTFYQYFSVRSPKKGFGQISGTITTANHFNFWASKGLNLGNHDYMVLATEGYQSRGSSDITVSEGTGGTTSSSVPSNGSGSSSSVSANTGGVLVRARGVAGGEHINLRIGGSTVASWNLTTSFQDLNYTGTASGDIQVQFDNDGGSRDVVVDYIRVNGETRQAEDMSYNTAFYTNGSCGGGGNSELMHCNGAIGFGYTYDCFSGNCSGGSTGGGTNSSVASSAGSTASCAGYVGITFDDGPGANTTTLVNLLKQNNLTPVTWFVQGNYVAANSNLMSQLLSVGEVQNHSYTHPHLINLGYQQIYDELNRTNQAIQNAGAPKPTLFRPPYGEVNTNVNQAAQALGLRVITWNVDSQDWNGASATAIANAANQLQNGQVILMHDANYNNTNAAIAQIASNLRAKGLCPGRIDAATGRAVAPAGAVASSSRSSSSTSIVASSSSVATGNACQCNWWGTRYPLCTNTASGWGWENNTSCITTSTCNSQGAGGGGVVCN
ncbi:glycoside hydrolase family 11 protein [Cellvibrio sp. QJXJ]|uniref:glycoside hydrolase family 11 protein n=1 Tax=Cellvibrio sp. QJXJ TaxID=2964606 RepID=UPI0021C444ED|nr:glycoside hydrolase family 11 protein [Cellvibrio sp. QJXJ]UUA71663.1 glycoside hydrolase family 11 protein [Cellvibrio sp. QJXJ]